MRGRAIGVSVVALAALVATAAAQAGETTSPSGLVQSTEVVHTPATPSRSRDRPAGAKLRLTFSVRRVDGAPPPSLNRLRIQLPKGLILNARRFPECQLAKLQAFGPSACRRGARIGRGTVVGDARPVVPNPVGGVVTAFNAKFGTPPRRRVLLYMRPSLGPAFINVGTLAREGRRWMLDIVVPITGFFQQEPPITRLDLTLGTTPRGVPFVANPRRCAAPGYRWTFEAYYFNSEVVTTPANAACTP
jgi:hypothetical protein